MKICLMILLLVSPMISVAQEKVEKERRVGKDVVPLQALEWFDDAYENARNTRWYLEETSGITSFEAKLKWKGKAHSVEFDTSGVVQDIEIAIQWKEIPRSVQENITAYFESTYQKQRVEKIQLQWTGSPGDLEDLIDESEEEELTLRYEIVYYGKTDVADSLWEGLFDDDGRLIENKKVFLGTTDNLFF